MDTKNNGRDDHNRGPNMAVVEEEISTLETIKDNEDLVQRAAQATGAIAFVHFDPSSATSNMVEALIHYDELTKVHRGLYVHILSTRDKRRYSGRIVEGPFYNPDTLRRDSTPVQFIILNQGQGKVLSLPEYHGLIHIEILGEELNGVLYGAMHRPHPASPVLPYDLTLMEGMLHLQGNIILGMLDAYDKVFIKIDENDKGVVPRNWLTVGTIGSGKSNTTQVFVEETLAANYAQIIVDPEGEYVFMDEPSDAPGVEQDLLSYGRKPQGVKNITVYRPPLSESKRENAVEFSVPFDSLSPEIIVELAEMSTAQETRFTFLYEQAIQLLRKKNGGNKERSEELDLSRGYPGTTLNLLLNMLDQEIEYYQRKKENKNLTKSGSKEQAPERKIYCHEYQLQPLVQDQQDLVSYSALRKKLRELKMTNIFDRKDAPKLDMKQLCRPGHLSVIDMSDAQDQQVVNIVIADLLARMYHHKMSMNEEENAKHKVFITIEEAHGFVSRQKQDKMEQTLDQLRRIARRGRKRWLALHFVTQSPQHLPSELFELANNKIIHQTTGSENLRVLKAAAGTINEGIWSDVPSLGRGRAIIVSAQYPHPIITRIRPAASRRNYTI